MNTLACTLRNTFGWSLVSIVQDPSKLASLQSQCGKYNPAKDGNINPFLDRFERTLSVLMQQPIDGIAVSVITDALTFTLDGVAWNAMTSITTNIAAYPSWDSIKAYLIRRFGRTNM